MCLAKFRQTIIDKKLKFYLIDAYGVAREAGMGSRINTIMQTCFFAISALPIDGTFPTATAQWDKRNIAQQIPVWDAELCIQCGKCVMVCPHAVIRAKVYDSLLLSNAPPTFKTAQPCWREFASLRYTLQVAPEDCTGCRLCVEICPAKSKSEVKHKAINMEMQAPLRQQESANWEFFLSLPEFDRERISHTQVKDTQLLEPLFEFSGACAGCGETPYIKLLTQLFGH